MVDAMRILVAEDDRALRDVLQRGLREAGYVVDVASDGEQALANLTSVDYEVAVLDCIRRRPSWEKG